MAEPPPRSEHELEIAAADWLLGDSAEIKAAASPLIADGQSAEFQIVDLPDEPEPEAEAQPGGSPAKPVAAIQVGGVKLEKTRRTTRPAQPARAARVEQVWSRGAEWGGTLGRLAVWLAIVLGLTYASLAGGYYLAGLAFVFIGGLVAIALCYPIFITLERPVRITPEQAARDYFNALSHRIPHYRRMWLLLSEDGRTSSRFASFGEFVRYWNARRAELSDGKAGFFAPLLFQVQEFNADKSAGKTELDAKFKVRVSGQPSNAAIGVIPLKRGFVRGPDKMWYLNDGTLESSRHDAAEDDAD